MKTEVKIFVFLVVFFVFFAAFYGVLTGFTEFTGVVALFLTGMLAAPKATTATSTRTHGGRSRSPAGAPSRSWAWRSDGGWRSSGSSCSCCPSSAGSSRVTTASTRSRS